MIQTGSNPENAKAKIEEKGLTIAQKSQTIKIEQQLDLIKSPLDSKNIFHKISV